MPKNDGYSLIAEPGDHAPWALYGVSSEGDGVPTAGSLEASEELRVLLNSAYDYPPALALAREAMSVVAKWYGSPPTYDEFSAHLMNVLRDHFRAQSTAKYRFVEAVADQVGYMARGAFYWVLRVDLRSGTAWWVSGDYDIYRDPMIRFRLSEEDVRALSSDSSGPT